jgi:hypothetical protein
MAGKGGGGVEGDDHRAGLQLVDDTSCNLADRGIRYGEDHDISAIERGIGRRTIDAEIVLQARLAGVADLDMTNIKTGTFEIFGQPVSHFSAGAKEGNCSHVSSPSYAGLVS